MSEQNKRGNPTWRAGVSGNPAGRPRRGESLAERVRELVDPDQLIAFLEATYQDKSVAMRERLQAAQQLRETGWGKAEATTNLRIDDGRDDVPDVENWSPQQLEAYIARGLAAS